MIVEDIALTMTYGVGVKSSVHLLDIFGSAERVFAASTDELIAKAEARNEVARNIVERKAFSMAEREIAYCAKHNIKAIASTDAEYPKFLREINDYPHVIYVKGSVEALSKRCLSIVGTREATEYGKLMCMNLVRGLAQRVPDICIVSGLAFGIDSEAHRAALAENVPTVAVLPCTLSEIVPAQHANIAKSIVDNGGALVSELHSQVKQKGVFYTPRNRIIAALSVGTVVIESPADGGSLITVAYADGYNRTVMAYPGRANDRMSSATNRLIHNQKAQMVMSADDVINELMWDVNLPDIRARPRPANIELTADDVGLLNCFRSNDPLAITDIAELSGMDIGMLSALLLGLEVSGAVRLLPGNRYERLIAIDTIKK